MFLLGRTLPGRRVEQLIHRAHQAPAPLTEPTTFPDLDTAACVQTLIRDGIAFGLQLPMRTVREIRAFADATPCFSPDRQDHGFRPGDVAKANARRDRDVITAHYFETVEECEAIASLRDDPALRAIAAAYLGPSAVWNRTRLWWSFAAGRVSDDDLHAASQDKFHFDMNGWHTLKFFFYLTPVDESSGPHRCIPGTHVQRALRHQLTLTVGRPIDELERIYGKDRFLTVTGDAGAGFAEDPFIFHTGTRCRPGRRRLMLEIEFGSTEAVRSYRYGRLG